MTTDTTYREKGRAVFLAAIMVLSMVSMSAAMVGTTAADHEPDPETSAIGDLDGDRFWQGQTLNISEFGSGDTVEFEHEDRFRQRTADDNGYVEVSTSGWNTGNWDVSDESGNSGNFTLSEQELETFEFDPAAADGDTDLEIESNRASFDIEISADGLDAEDLDEADTGDVGELREHDGDDVFVVSVTNAQADITFDSTEFDADETYEFEGEVLDTGVSATTELEVLDPADAAIDFVGGPFNEEEGDIAEIELEANAIENAWVNVSLEDYDYTATIELEDLDDLDDDETVTIEANLYQMGHGEEDTFTGDHVADAQEMGDMVQRMTDNDNRFVDGFNFRLRAFTSEPPASAADVSRLRVRDRSTDDLTVHTAPQGTDTDVDVEDLLEDATETDTIAEGDLVIAQIEASGIYGYLNDTPAGFDDAGENLSFALESEEEGPFGAEDETLDFDDGLEDASIIVDDDNDQFFVVVETEGVEDFEDESEWEAVFTVGYENHYVAGDDDEDDETVSDSFEIEERNLEITGDFDDDERLIVANTDDSEITAETNVAPGTEGNYYVETQEDTFSDDFTVGEAGELVATFDFSDAEAGEILPSIEFDEDGGESDDTEGIFGDVDEEAASFQVTADAPANVNVGDDASLDVTVENAGDADGEASITVTIDGEEVEAVNEELAAGDSWEQSYDVPTDEEGDVEWDVSTQHDSASGTVSVGEEDDDTEMDDDMDGDMDDDDADDGQPGFGVIVALFALIGAALLALRRQN